MCFRPPSGGVQKKTCPKCDAVNPASAETCSECGEPLPTPEHPVGPAKPGVPAPPGAPKAPTPPGAPKEPPRGLGQ